MKNKNIIFLATLVILIIVILVAVALLKAVPSYNQNYATTTENAPFSNTTEEGYSLYVNNKYGFSIMYPTSLQRISADMVGDADGLDTTDIFVGEIPKSTFEGTNLYDVKIIAGAKITDQNTCAYMIYGNDARKMEISPKPEDVRINGINFTKIKIKDAGAGNIYDTTRYSTYKNGTCYELLAVAHSANIGILQENDPNVKQYDDSDLMTEFDEIVSFFKFTK